MFTLVLVPAKQYKQVISVLDNLEFTQVYE